MNSPPQSANPFQFVATPETEAVFALERLLEEVRRADAVLCNWKWALIAGHNATQNFMVLALDSDGREAIFSPRYQKEFHQWWVTQGAQGTPPEPYMAVFMELYKRLATPIDLSEDMEALNVWRNDFIHFYVNRFVVKVNLIPRRLLGGLQVVEHCGWNPGRFAWSEEDMKRRAMAAHAECVPLLWKLMTQYETP